VVIHNNFLVTGRIKRKNILAMLESLSVRDDKDAVCPLCERNIPRAQRDAHHLIPKSHRGTETVVLHRICHRQIHALFTETELARQFNHVDALKNNEEMSRFIKWVKEKPDDFFEKSRKSHRLKSR
jgi:hypothetical protein